ncbi:Pol I core factor CF [Allomyces arbusculus]|nr:Pol I core factor CF [Allomyces arbusculus]
MDFNDANTNLFAATDNFGSGAAEPTAPGGSGGGRKSNRRPPCPVCQSRKFRRRTGQLYCEFGHQQQGYFEAVSDDVAEGRSMGRRMRVPKAKREREKKEKQSVVYGEEGRYLALEAFQTMLQIMIKAMVTDLQFPAEFETVCRDIWFMIADTHSIDLPNPELDATDTLATGAPATSQPDPLQPARKRANHLHRLIHGLPPDEDDHVDEFGRAPVEPSSSAPAAAGQGLAYDADKVKRELQAMTQQSGKEAKPPTLTLAHAPCIMYLGAVWLRLPVLVADLHRWCASNQIPYMTAFRQLPDSIRKSLMRELHHTLHPWYLPNPERLRRTIHSIVHTLRAAYDITPPPLPLVPLALRMTVTWCLPSQHALLLTRLAQSLSLVWTQHHDPDVALVHLAETAAMSLLADRPASWCRAWHTSVESVLTDLHQDMTTYPTLRAWAERAPAAFAAFVGKTAPGAFRPDGHSSKWDDVVAVLEEALRDVDKGDVVKRDQVKDPTPPVLLAPPSAALATSPPSSRENGSEDEVDGELRVQIAQQLRRVVSVYARCTVMELAGVSGAVWAAIMAACQRREDVVEASSLVDDPVEGTKSSSE